MVDLNADHFIIESGSLRCVVAKDKLESSLKNEMAFIMDLKVDNINELLTDGNTKVTNSIGQELTVSITCCNCPNILSHPRNSVDTTLAQAARPQTAPQTVRSQVTMPVRHKKGGALALIIFGSIFAFIGFVDLLAYFTDASSSARYPVLFAALLLIGAGGIIWGIIINMHSRVKGTMITDKAESIREKEMRNSVSKKQVIADIDQVVDEPSGSTKLHIACSSGNVNEVRNLLNQGAAVNVTNKWDATPLDLAYSNGSGQHHQTYAEIASLLKAKGGKTNKWKGVNT